MHGPGEKFGKQRQTTTTGKALETPMLPHFPSLSKAMIKYFRVVFCCCFSIQILYAEIRI